MSNQVEEFLALLKRTLDGVPHTEGRQHKLSPVEYIIADVADPFTGHKLGGKYFVLDRVGSGAMSVVYKARQDPIDRIVAIKLLKKEWSNDPLTVKRFQREAKAVSSLRHKNIPAIMDIGTADTGQPFFVTELIEGRTIEQMLDADGSLEPERATNIFVQVCDALAHAHKQGLIHRDIKPGNIMVVDDNSGTEQVKLVDFGIVKLAKSQAASQQLTQKGEIWGSPVYMSPEQCHGSGIDHRSDIYSMGTVMYEVLTGKQAFEGKSIPIILSKQLNEMPPAFSSVLPDHNVPKKLEDIVFRSLQKSPEKRYQSMDDFKAALEDVLQDYERSRRKLSGKPSFPNSSNDQRVAAGFSKNVEQRVPPSPASVPAPNATPNSSSPPISSSGSNSKMLIIVLICLALVSGGITIGVIIGTHGARTSHDRSATP